MTIFESLNNPGELSELLQKVSLRHQFCLRGNRFATPFLALFSCNLRCRKGSMDGSFHFTSANYLYSGTAAARKVQRAQCTP